MKKSEKREKGTVPLSLITNKKISTSQNFGICYNFGSKKQQKRHGGFRFRNSLKKNIYVNDGQGSQIAEEESSMLKPRAIRKDLKRNWTLYLILIPVLAFYIIFHYFPMFGIVMAFERFNPTKGFFGSEWVGFKWFEQFFSSYYFTRLLKNTLLLSLKDILIGFPAPIILALLLNEIKNQHFKKSVQTISYMPYFISVVVMSMLIIEFFSSTGAVTQFFMAFGMEPTNMLGDNRYFQGIFVGTNLWQYCGFNSIIYLAAISGVDPELYDAAIVDGANRWQQTWHVTLPGISTTIIILLIMRLGSLFSVGYEKIILLYSPAVYETADTISSFVYRSGLKEANYSYAAAVILFNAVMNFILLISFNTLSRKLTERSLF